jgi:hypothetical protein
MQPVTLLGRRGQPAAEAAREFLARNDALLHWVDLDSDPLLPYPSGEAIASARERPLALFADGGRLQAPQLFAEPTPVRLDPALTEANVSAGRWRTALAAGAGLPTPARASRTTPASRTASAAPSSPRAAIARPSGSERSS